MRRPLFISLLFLTVLLAASANLPQANAVKVGRNINLTTDVHRQVFEPTIAVDPRNASIIVAGAVDNRLVGQGGRTGWPAYYRSTDGGKTWTSRLIPGFPGDTSPEGLSSPLRRLDGWGDPGLAFDASGNVYWSGLGANVTDLGTPIFSTLTAFVARFANDGADYVGATILPTKNPIVDFPRIAVDRSGGPNDGNVYVSFGCCPDSAQFTRSADHGLSFSDPIGISGPGSPQSLTVDLAGNIFALLVAHSLTGGKGATWLVAKSTNGGLTFDKPVVVAKITSLPTPLTGNSVDVTGDAPWIAADSNGVYVVGDDSSTGQTNIVFTKSTDGGLSWTSLTKVNDVAIGTRFFATVAVSAGIISIAWYDSRLGQLPNGTISGLDVFYAQSRNGGSSFSKNVRVTSVSFDPNLVFSPLFQLRFIGDYFTIDASPDAVHVIWTDNRNACDTVDPTEGCIDQDAYTATITP